MLPANILLWLTSGRSWSLPWMLGLSFSSLFLYAALTLFCLRFRRGIVLPPTLWGVTGLLLLVWERGGELLRTTELPIQEVAKRSGYDNPLTFTKMFKKTYGVSPREYRIRMAVSEGLPDGGENEYSV